MGENKRCEHECTCKTSLGHYLVVAGGFLRIASLVFGIAFSAEAEVTMPYINEGKKHLDTFIELIDKVTEAITR